MIEDLVAPSILRLLTIGDVAHNCADHITFTEFDVRHGDFDRERVPQLVAVLVGKSARGFDQLGMLDGVHEDVGIGCEIENVQVQYLVPAITVQRQRRAVGVYQRSAVGIEQQRRVGNGGENLL